MLKEQYDAIAIVAGVENPPLHHELVESTIRLRHIESQVDGTLVGIGKSRIHIRTDAGKSLKGSYPIFDELDVNGNVKVNEIVDMTGRVIVIGSWICYSVLVGKKAHSLQIGQVQSITPQGKFNVVTALNGGRISTWNQLVGDPQRTVLLPMDASELVHLRMIGFAKLNV